MKHFRSVLKVLLIFLSLTSVSCKGQSNEEKMIKTTDSVIYSIKNGSENNFINLIGVNLKTIGKNKELIHHDFTKLQRFIEMYPNTDKIVIDPPNELGQKVIQVLFYEPNSSNKKDIKLRLDLYYGPPNINSLNKISGYKILVTNF